jgi:hypothetical protein
VADDVANVVDVADDVDVGVVVAAFVTVANVAALAAAVCATEFVICICVYANYFMYYTAPRIELIRDSEEPQQLSLQELESLEKPPPDYTQQLLDYYNHNFVGQVIA